MDTLGSDQSLKIELIDLTVRDLVAGYRDDGEGGARGYGDNNAWREPCS